MTWHQTIVIGNLGSDPEMKYLPSGTPVTNFSVAVNETWKDRDGQKQEKVTWYNVAVFGGAAEACHQHLFKGRQVMVTGTVSANPWTNRDGEARASLDLKARQVKFLGGGNGSGERSEGRSDSGDSDDIDYENFEDIPF